MDTILQFRLSKHLHSLRIVCALCSHRPTSHWRSSTAQILQGLRYTDYFFKFFYASFLKPHTGDGALTGQQAALESFYKAQADIYDTSRKLLLRGREDMLGLAAAQLKYKAEKGAFDKKKPIWVDIGGGTGYNIEAMQVYLDVPTFSPKYTLSIFLLPFSKWPGNDSTGWDGK